MFNYSARLFWPIFTCSYPILGNSIFVTMVILSDP